jgi:enoyl-CoA hydratase
MRDKYVKLNTRNGIAWVKFDRPDKLNALNPEVLADLEAALIECEKDESIRVVVLTGGDKAFIAGADIKHMASGDIPLAYALSDQTMKVQARLADLPKPTIAAIAGYALGGGCEMALCCDFRIAAENAKLGFPEITLGIIPGGGGTQRLPRLVGLGPATELVFLGEMIDAQKAEHIGLVNKTVPLENLDTEAEKLANKLMERPVWGLRAAKTALRTGLNCSLEDGLRIEQDAFCMLFGTQDKTEGMKAFLEKRKAQFTGK